MEPAAKRKRFNLRDLKNYITRTVVINNTTKKTAIDEGEQGRLEVVLNKGLSETESWYEEEIEDKTGYFDTTMQFFKYHVNSL